MASGQVQLASWRTNLGARARRAAGPLSCCAAPNGDPDWGRDRPFMRPCVRFLRHSWEPTQRCRHRCGDGTQRQHVERAARQASPGMGIGQCQNYSVCALLGAEAEARGAMPFSSPGPSFTDSRRRYPRVGCRHDRMERTVLLRRNMPPPPRPREGGGERRDRFGLSIPAILRNGT